MPEAAAVWLVNAAEAAIVGEMVLTASQVAAAATAIQVATSVYVLREQQRRAENRARDSYNASLRDRYSMVRGAVEQRQLVLGRQRVSGPIGFMRSYGTNQSKLVFTVVLAAHEIDAVEAIYFDDELVSLDNSGNVTGITRRETFSISAASAAFTLQGKPAAGTVTAVAYYGSTTVSLGTSVSGSTVTVSGAQSSNTGRVVISYRPDPNPYAPTQTSSYSETFSYGAGTHTVTLQNLPDAGSVVAVESSGYGVDRTDVTLGVSVSGSQVTYTSSGDPVTISYQGSSAYSYARVRAYLGAPGQTADAAMQSNLPGVWTTAHKGTGLAYLVVELDYNETAFPNGLPNVSALVRGLKAYDPRTGLTAWSENPALLARAYATHALGGRLPTSLIDDASVTTAANVCDASVSYSVGGRTYTRARYTAGMTPRAGVRPQDVLNDLTQAMGGRWALADGKLRLKAGAYTSPVMAINEAWLHVSGAVSVQPTRPRSDMINTAVGTLADQEGDYQITQYPKVIASAYVSADGAELPADLNYAAVTFNGQAQYLAACELRYARQGLTVKLTCNMRAYQAEVFDVVTVSLARFGWVDKTFEVLDTSWTLDGGIELTLKEIDASIWTMDAGFSDVDPAPNTRLPTPWGLPSVLGLSLTSGTSTLLRLADGTIVPRILASWTAQTDLRVAQQGSLELRWGASGDPDSAWFSTIVPGSATSVYLESVKEGIVYLVKARTVGALTVGNWSAQLAHKVVGKSGPPSNVSGFAYVVSEAGVEFSWTPCPDADYESTVIKLGSTWASATRLFDGAANKWIWVRPASGTYTVLIKHRDTSGNESTTAASVSFTYASAAINNSAVTLTSSGTLVGGGGGSISLGSVAGTLASGQLGAIVDATKFASGVEPVTIVTGSLPTTKSTNTIYRTDDGKLYRWNGSAYVATLPTTDLTGTISDAQIAGLAASKVTGQLTNSQIADVAAAKLTGQITETQISNDAISTPKLAAGAITTAKIAAGAVTADTVAANAITSAKIEAGAITTAKLAAGAVTANEIAAATITGGKIAAGTITATQIASNTITAGQIAASAIGASQIAAGAITTGKIAAGAVTSNEIDSRNLTIKDAAGNIVFSATGVVGGGNLAANGDFQLESAGVPVNFANYNNSSVSITNSVNSGGPIQGAKYWRITVNASGSTQFGFYFNTAASCFGGWKANTNYIVSFLARCNNHAGATFQDAWNNAPPFPAGRVALQNPGISSSWQRYVWLINFGNNTPDPNGFWTLSQTNLAVGTQLDFACIQVEQGDAPSGWAPAPITSLNPVTPSNISTFIEAAAIGSLDVATTGKVRSGKTTYGSGTGWLLEYNGGTPRFDIGTSDQYMRWTGSALEIKTEAKNLITTGLQSVYVFAGGYKTSGTASGGIRFESDGEVRTSSNGGTYNLDSNWFSPTTASIGSSYYIRFSKLSGVTPTGDSLNTWLQLNVDRTLSVSRSTTGASNASLAYEISNSSSGSPVLSSGYLDFNVEVGT